MKHRKWQLGVVMAAAGSLFASGAAGADQQGTYIGLVGGVGLLNDTAATVSSGGVATTGTLEFSDGPIGGIVTGYTFANGLRPELEVTYRRNRFDGGGGNVRTASGVASLYYNFSNKGYYFYVGGGGGYANLRAYLDEAGGDTANKAVYSAGTGLGFAATRNLQVGVDYRFTGTFDRPVFTYDVGGAPVDAAFRYRGSVVTIGLRYSFGAIFGGGEGSGVRAGDEDVRVVPVSR